MVLGYPPEDVRQFIINHRPPPYDAEVKWLESTGTQWIDTGIHGANNFHVKVVATRDLAAASFKYIFGVADSVFSIMSIGCNRSKGRCNSALFSTLTQFDQDGLVADDGLHTFEIDTTSSAMVAVVDGTIINSRTSSEITITQQTIRLFGMALNNIMSYTSCRIASFSIKDTTTDQFIIDLIPVRFTNELGQSDGAMYNRLGVGGMNPDGSPRNDGLYRNQGTGSFLFGDDV